MLVPKRFGNEAIAKGRARRLGPPGLGRPKNGRRPGLHAHELSIRRLDEGRNPPVGFKVTDEETRTTRLGWAFKLLSLFAVSALWTRHGEVRSPCQNLDHDVIAVTAQRTRALLRPEIPRPACSMIPQHLPPCPQDAEPRIFTMQPGCRCTVGRRSFGSGLARRIRLFL